MKKILLCVSAVLLFAAACSDDTENDAAGSGEAPVVVSTEPANDATDVPVGDIDISVVYDRPIEFAPEDVDRLTFTGGRLESAAVTGSANTLTVQAYVSAYGTRCTLTIPAGVVTGTDGQVAGAVTLHFTTEEETVETPDEGESVALVNPDATAEAQALYDYLWSVNGKQILSATMAKDGVNGVTGSWNTAGADDVYAWTGQYPAINCFDYGHLCYSPTNWIDYNDITPVTEWAGKGGIVGLMWHWNVPMSAPGDVLLSSEETVMPQDWSKYVYLSAGEFAGARVGSQIIVYVKDVLSGAVGAFQDGMTWTGLPGYEGLSIDGDSFTMTLDASLLETVRSNGLVVKGCNYTLVRVVMTNASAPSFSFYRENNGKTNEFDAANATLEGTWENEVFKVDLAECAGYLKLLQDRNIPVIWRPLHEAAGGWFWWGKDAASFKKLWIAMFDYFRQEGVNNLIWVWTTEINDADWYPGDAYVDIIGRDLYGNSAADCASQYETIAGQYGHKMVALTECGYSTYTSSGIGRISEQWAQGARWTWFMPWYDSDASTTFHADRAWWQDAMSQEYVISRDELPDWSR